MIHKISYECLFSRVRVRVRTGVVLIWLQFVCPLPRVHYHSKNGRVERREICGAENTQQVLEKLQNEIEELFDYNHWEQYVALAARISGVMIWDFWVFFGCITEGRKAANGWDVGLCAGRITSLMVDTLF